jgi:CRISPR-associated protein Cmr4
MADHLTGGLLGLHALTSIHPGSGTALGTVDLPVQRERHTHWPNIAGSALKGILRDAARERIKDKYQDDTQDDERGRRRSRRDKANADDQDLVAVFGPATADADKHAGALSVTDGRLLAFPVRSLKGVFAWVTCKGVLQRLERDAAIVGVPFDGPIPTPDVNQAVVAANSPCLVEGKQLVLEEFQFTKAEGDPAGIAQWVAKNLLPQSESYRATRERLSGHLVVLDDNDFTHFVQHACEIVARVGLNYDTKTVKEGALFYQEFLPTETIFYAVVIANAARAHHGTAQAADILKTLSGYLPPMLQVGGDETTGKGYCGTRLYTTNGVGQPAVGGPKS